jgi:hypothetical protein
MDIRTWPLDQVMSLPDCVFGQRWFVGCFLTRTGTDDVYAISEENLPDICVVWGMLVTFHSSVNTDTGWIGLRMSDILPTTTDEFMGCERIFRGLSSPQTTIDVVISKQDHIEMTNVRKLIRPQGRRLVVRVATSTSAMIIVNASILVSSIPREIPDWWVSGWEKGR